jgi:hypothetical protein
MPVYALDDMPSSELSEWMAFYEMEPFGPTRDNIHSAMICSLLHSAFRGKRQEPMSVSDFMLKDVQEQKESDTAQFMTGLRSLAKRKGNG